MVIFLIIILYFSLFQNYSFEKNVSINILKSILSFSFTTVFITELLSLINNLNLLGIAISWTIIFIVLLYFVFKKKPKLNFLFIYDKFKTLSILEKTLISFIVLIVALLFFQGILYPPNNWDSLTYHMSRIMYWLSNENLDHFPTHILRHLYQPPFAEYLIMNVNVFQGNDYFSNSIQLFFLLFCLFPLNELLNLFNVNKTAKLITFLFCITTPSVMLQASTTKNDIVCAFFILTSILFLYKCYKESSLSNYFFLGISIGLGMLTKGTFYLFIFPALLIFLFFIVKQLFYEKKFKPILFGLLSIFMLLLINIGHFSRNYSINNNILSIDDEENKMFWNEEMNFTFFSSNLLKNIGLHMGYPFTANYNELLEDFHEKNNISIDNPKLNFLGLKYTSPKKFETHEDLVPNTFHFVLLLIVYLFLLFNSVYKKNYKILLLLCTVLLQIILFTIYLKWQPWHTRLHIPLFILSSVFIGFFFNLFKKPYLSYLLSFGFISSFWFYYVHNNTRPIITNRLYTKNIFTDDTRFKKYFANQMFLYPEYANVLNKMYKYNPKKVGLEIYDWEYPILAEYYYDHLKVVSINVVNNTNKIKQNINNIDVIISNKNNGNEYVFNGKTYTNKTPENKHIWIYE